jgi:hypothetical protein
MPYSAGGCGLFFRPSPSFFPKYNLKIANFRLFFVRKKILCIQTDSDPFLLLYDQGNVLGRQSNKNYEFSELLCKLVFQNRHFHCCARSELPPVWVDLREGGGCTDAPSSLLLHLLTGNLIQCCGSISIQEIF